MNQEQKKGRQMRISEIEVDLIKKTFKDNEKLLKLLRKIFLPELDPDTPLGQNIDLWMTVPIGQMTSDQAVINILARNQLINHIEQQLIQLNILANTDAKSLAEVKEQMRKNSTK